jgi:tetratricopeptide (TPR) repeat protein
MRSLLLRILFILLISASGTVVFPTVSSHHAADGVRSCPSQHCVEDTAPPIEPTAKKVKTIPFKYSERPEGINNSSDTTQSLEQALDFHDQANILAQQGHYDEAEKLYKRALAIYELEPEVTKLIIASELIYLAKLYYAEGRFSDAEAQFKRSLSIREKALAQEHPQVTLSLNHLAGFYFARGRYADAESLYKRLLAITEKASGSKKI